MSNKLFITKHCNDYTIASKVFTYGTNDPIEIDAYCRADKTNNITITLAPVDTSKESFSITLAPGEQVKRVFSAIETVTVSNTNGETYSYAGAVYLEV